MAKDNKGTPLQPANERLGRRHTVIAIFKKFGDIKISHPIDSYVNVFVVGNPGAGNKDEILFLLLFLLLLNKNNSREVNKTK